MSSNRTKITISIIIVIIIIVAGLSIAEFYHPSQKRTIQVLTDTSQTATPDHLDPASGFFENDLPLFSAIYQGLVEFNGSSDNVVPVLSDHVYVQNQQNYTFDLRSYDHFSNGVPLNATDVWFSFYRGIIMGQGPYSSDYNNILFNETDYGITGIALPWGIIPALESGGYTISGSNLTENYTIAANILDNILSNFNDNASNARIMSYPKQAIVINSEYNLTIKGMYVYSFMLEDLAGEGWGAIVEPSYIDAHGGVVYNTQNSFINLNGAIGSGPYEIKTVGASLSDVVLIKTPDYWAENHTGIPSVAQPAHIPEIVIDYALSHTDRLEDFDKNVSQISTVSPSSFKTIINGFYNSSEASYSLLNSMKTDSAPYISMNTQRSYTNNTNFRKALSDAMNYTALLDLYSNSYNGEPEAYEQLGPVSPMYGSNFYNPDNMSLPSMDLRQAIQNLTIAGREDNFYVTLPNGTVIGDKSGTDLSTHTFTITGISPPPATETSEIAIAIDSFSLIGLHFTSSYVTEGTVASWRTSAKDTPHFVELAWTPDFPDPIGQKLMPLFDINEEGNKAWVDNSTLQSYFTNLDFLNSTTQIKDMKVIYKITDNLSAYIWLPVEYTNYFVQPYVHGFVQNQFAGYFYNMLYISYGKGTSGTPSINNQSNTSRNLLITSDTMNSLTIIRKISNF